MFDFVSLRSMQFAGMAIFFMPASALALGPDATDARKIMEAVDQRPEGDQVVSRMVMKVRDGAGRERSRVVRSRALDFEGGRRQLMQFESPANVRNTGFLSIDHDAGDRDDDQWLYMPSLRKTTRISSGDRSGSFMGTDLSYSDMTRQDPADWDYKLIHAEKVVGGEPCWVIEGRPRTEKAQKETGYVKSRMWVSKTKLMILRSKSWVREGKKTKYIQFGDVRRVAGVWVAHRITAQTRRGKSVESTTVIAFTDYRLGQTDVTEADFSERRLEKGL